MFLERIIVKDFKNIGSADVQFAPKVNCICGDNGEGKTNLVDAVYYLSMCKSFLSSNDRYTCRYDAEEAVLHGAYCRDGEKEDVAVSVKRNGDKVVRRNSKAYKRISEHVGRIPVVMVSPSDISLIHDSGEERRRFVNMMLSQTDPAYLRAVVSYQKLLKQRNALLKDSGCSDLLLDTISERMQQEATYIYDRRREAVLRLNESASGYYSVISGEKENISIKYRSDLENTDLLSLFEANRAKDKVIGFTTGGVQRDDLEFSMGQYPLKKCASQGQQKSFLVALKMAQYAVMKEVKGVCPILLLDDLFDKLDRSRVEALVKMVMEDTFGQIFITDTDMGRLMETVGEDTDGKKFFRVCGGKIEMEDSL